MTILETFIKLRDDLKLWVANNLSMKADISHNHTVGEITDYTVDTTLSPTSTNPVANSTLAAEFEAISDAMNVLDLAIDSKADSTHDHNDTYYTQTELDEALLQKSQVQIVTFNENETESTIEDLLTLKIHKLTQEQYDQELANGTIDESAIYLTPDQEIDLTPYVTIDQLNTKADSEHTHKISDITSLQSSLDERVLASRTINGKALTEDISLSASDVSAADAAHNHDDAYYAKTYIDEALDGKADTSHSHDDVYYTEAEIDELLLSKADAMHNHDDSYDTKGSAYDALESAKSYADIAATTAANAVKDDLLNGAGEAYDTLKELGDLIDENTDAILALETIASGKANEDHNHDDRYYTETEVDELIANHNHDSIYDSIGAADIALKAANAYTDNAVVQKSQVQIITWEADD